MVLCKVIVEVTSHHFRHVLFIRSKSLGPAHIQGMSARRQGSLGTVLEVCLSQHLTSCGKEQQNIYKYA